MAVLVPCSTTRPRVPGAQRGRIRIGEDFDELPPDVASALGRDKPQR